MKNQYKIRTIICKGCGESVTKRVRDGTKYCSSECYRRSLRPQRKTGKVVNCNCCGKTIYRRKNELEKSDTHFCSVIYANSYQGRNKVEFICPVCENKFYWSKSVLKSRFPKYCSIKCRESDPNYMGHIMANLAQSRNKGLNKLEIAGKQILDDIGIDYQEQVSIENKFLVDVFIPSKNIVIQWDGDYWHGYGKDIEEVEDRIKKRMQLDISQDAYMEKCGYIIMRFWEHEVYHERNRVSDNIKEAVR